MVDQIIVNEVTMATPDCICVEIWDGQPERGRIQYLTTADSGGYDFISGGLYNPVFVQRNNPFHGGALEYCKVVGPDKKALRFMDVRPTAVLGSAGRAACKIAANWSVTGRTVTAVYYKNRPNNFFRDYTSSSGIIGGNVVLKHYFFLKLDASLSQGAKTITPPAATGLAPIAFTFDDRVTRAFSIHATQASHKPADEAKVAILSLWLPGYGIHGIVDFDATYGLVGTNKFEIIDASNATVHTGNISVQRRTLDYDEWVVYRGGTTDTFLMVLDCIAGASGKIRLRLLSNKGFATGMQISVGSGSNGIVNVGTITGVPGANGIFTVTVPAANVTDIDLDGTTFSGAYTGGGIVQNIYYSASTTGAVKTISGFTVATEAVFTSNAHGLANGDIGFIDDWDDGTLAASRNYAMAFYNGALVMISDVTANTFKAKWMDYFTAPSVVKYVDTLTTPRGSAASCAGTFTPARLSNKAGTDTFRMDYSSWTSGNGTYRVRVPGLGVSDPFNVSDQAWYDAAHAQAKGEYHQRGGVALDGRFGYTRPASWQDSTLTPNLYSKLPISMTKLGGIVFPTSPVLMPVAGTTGFSPWITTTRIPRVQGWYDAGDWDQVLLSHISWTLMLCELYISYPGARASTFNIPKSSTILDSATYAAADVLGDVAHQVIFELDWLRAAQDASGWVPSAFMYWDDATNTDSPGWYDEPSWLNRNKHVVCAGDHVTTYLYAGCAAKLAQVFQFAGLTTLKNLWQASAVAAFNWAEGIYTNTTTRDNYYNGVLGIQAGMGWTTTAYNAVMADLNNACSSAAYGQSTRAVAAACLGRLTGDLATYGPVFLASYGDYVTILPCVANWDYKNTPGADATWLSNHGTSFWTGLVDQNIVSDTAPMSFPMAKQFSDEQYGNNGCATDLIGPVCIFAHRLSGTAKYAKLIQHALIHYYGVNPLGYCFTNGLGHRHIRGHTFLDCHFGDGILEQPDGVCSYMYCRPGAEAALFQGGTESNQWISNHLDLTTYPAAINCYQEPPAKYWPWYERVYEYPYCITQMEYTVWQTTVPHEVASLYLAVRDGSVPTSDMPPPSGLRLIYRKA